MPKARLAAQRDELHGAMPTLLSARPAYHKLLHLLVAHRRHDAAVRRALANELRRDRWRSRGDEDPIVRGAALVSGRCVTGDHLHVPVSELVQKISGLLCKGRVPFHADDVPSELAQDRCLVSRAGPDLEDVMVAPYF